MGPVDTNLVFSETASHCDYDGRLTGSGKRTTTGAIGKKTKSLRTQTACAADIYRPAAIDSSDPRQA